MTNISKIIIWKTGYLIHLYTNLCHFRHSLQTLIGLLLKRFSTQRLNSFMNSMCFNDIVSCYVTRESYAFFRVGVHANIFRREKQLPEKLFSNSFFRDALKHTFSSGKASLLSCLGFKADLWLYRNTQSLWKACLTYLTSTQERDIKVKQDTLQLFVREASK